MFVLVLARVCIRAYVGASVATCVGACVGRMCVCVYVARVRGFARVCRFVSVWVWCMCVCGACVCMCVCVVAFVCMLVRVWCL